MKTVFTQLLISVVLLMGASDALTQSSYNIHAGPSFPMSKIDIYTYEFNEYKISSIASAGATIGVQYSYQIANSGIGLFIGLDFIYNDVIKEFKDSVRYYLTEWTKIELLQVPKYFNIPISTGLKYTFMSNEKISLFCNLGLTYNFFKVSDEVLSNSITEADWARSLGFKTALGLLIKQKVSISIDYMGLGEHEIGLKTTIGSSGELEGTSKQSVNLATLTFGWNF